MGIKVSLHFEKPARLWRFPVETVQNSEAGFEKSYQCSNVTASWRLRLEPGDTWRVSMALECVETDGNYEKEHESAMIHSLQ